jgi:glycosyltransferase involved in cell wall biosynthesis
MKHELPPRSISVAMCTLNAEKYLPELLESLARQSVQPSELVVCDDGSTDATLACIADFGRSRAYPVRVFQNPVTLRPAKNFEKAITLCQGELIALCDADDVWYPNKLATLAADLQSHPDVGGVFSDADLIDDASHRIGERLWQRALFDPAREKCWELDAQRLLRGNVVTGATLMVRADLREKFLPIPDSWIHDGWIAWMLVLQSKILACDRSLIGYRIHASQQTGMPGLSPAARLQRARATGSREYRAVAAQFSDLLLYARNHPDICDDRLCRRVERKRDHTEFRAQLNPHRLARWREIVSRRSDYAVYAQGWMSMLKDAFV